MATKKNTQSRVHYQDDLGNTIVLGKELARGGEGKVCLVQGDPNVVAKIYLDKILQKNKNGKKILAMCKLYNDDLAKFSALPQKVIFNSAGKPVGFLMQKVTNYKEIHNLYGISTKRKFFPQADWGFMVHAAKNLACAVDTLHKKNIIIGDINQGNILVNNQAMIKLIDCDSYQVEYNGEQYLCEVGVPEYTSPELQGKSFNGIYRTQNNDVFGLAVMIFKILMFGRHPYSGVGAPPEIENAITNGYYCFSKKTSNTTPFYSALVNELLTDEIKDLFDRAFSKQKNIIRPTAEEWIDVLDNLENKLIQCTSGHKYLKGTCIWCKLKKQGFNPFGNNLNKSINKQTPYKSSNKVSNNASNNQHTNNASSNNYGSQQPTQNPKTYYKTNPVSNSWNWKPIVITVIVIWIIGAIINSKNANVNSNNSYTKPETNIVDNQEAVETKKEYTEKERQKDLTAYKDKFLSKVKSNWHPNNESFLIDNNSSIEVNITKDGYVTCPVCVNSVCNANDNAMNQAIGGKNYYEPLPESYDKENLSFMLYFEGNADLYWGRTKEQKSNYQVSFSPMNFAKNKVQDTPKTNITNVTSENGRKKVYSNSEQYLSNVYNIIQGEYKKQRGDSLYSVDGTISLDGNNNVKCIERGWNEDNAYNFISENYNKIPMYVNSTGEVIPLIIKFEGHNVKSVSLKYQPTVKKISKTDDSMNEFYKINSMHKSSDNNFSEYGEFSSFVNDKTPQRTKDIIKMSVNSPNKQTSKTSDNIKKSQEWFFE